MIQRQNTQEVELLLPVKVGKCPSCQREGRVMLKWGCLCYGPPMPNEEELDWYCADDEWCMRIAEGLRQKPFEELLGPPVAQC